MFLRRIALLLGLFAVATACGEAASGQGVDPPDTAAVGGLPALEQTTSTTAPTPVSTIARTTVPIEVSEQIGAKVPGNRVLLIGDSVMASTSQRYGGEMCDALVPLGWQAEVNAETGRFIDFGDQVLDSRLAAGWDVSVVLLGNNYGDNQDVFRDYMDDIVARLSPKPVVLITVSEFRASRAEVNAVIFEMAQKYPNVVVLDWAAVTAATPSLTGADGLHLTQPGRQSLAGHVSLVLGPAPLQPGKCLSSNFRDDSAGSPDGPTTTVKRTTRPTTTVANTGSTTPKTTVPGSSVPVTSGPATTTGSSPATTNAPNPTTTPATAAPTTSPPPPTDPPTTAP